ncbi:MAG TPA: CRISPR-associated helicase Cas3' [Bacteroidales bacterium]|nr:CRISPR-associated helicase Cas3' [Bacteroidales bacterium]
MYLAHIKKGEDKEINQTLEEHLINVAKLSSIIGSKLGLNKTCELLGLLHDLGKYSSAFQNYLKSATGIIDQDEDEYVDSGNLKGKIDHSTAGAQYIWNYARGVDKKLQIALQTMALCLASHHSGLIDCISPEGENEFSKRMAKTYNKTYLEEVIQNADKELLERINKLISDSETYNGILKLLKRIATKNKNEIINRFQAGLLVKMLYSCLIDADRTDTADFEYPRNAKNRQYGSFLGWGILIDRLEKHLLSFEKKPDKKRIDEIRKNISDACKNRAKDKQGIYTLTVPTGGGKTLASLRFALHHAHKHKLERIIYVIPYTSIIDQNAQVVRNILEIDDNEKGRVVLEHHSNLLPERQNWKTKILTENWDAPVVFTTSVQFLETIFGAGTRSARRLHQLAKAVIIFDEIQTLPIKTVHLFNNTINFLINYCNTTVLLCTATQPLLNKTDENKGQLNFTDKNEIVPNIEALFNDLKRVQVINKYKPEGWSFDEIAGLSIEQAQKTNNCLVVVNTKKSAKVLFETIEINESTLPVYHLSTSMCPAHRLKILEEMKIKLQACETFICVSTQLIEAGVDIDFGTVIRFVAGIDSIVQAAGRCNRNGKREISRVFVVNPKDEIIDSLEDIKVGKEVCLRILNEMKNQKAGLPSELIHPKTIERYFQYYFYRRADLMSYPVDIGHDDNLLRILSTNDLAVREHIIVSGLVPEIYFRQSFQTAAEKFKSIDAPTIGIVVPYQDEGKKLITDLFSQFAFEKQNELLRKAQCFTVNVFQNVFINLVEQKLIKKVPEIGVYVLSDERYYHPKFGLNTEISQDYDTLIQ